MGIKKQFIRQKANIKIQRLEYMLQGMVIVLSVIVLCDSFIHSTPLFYILFYFSGLAFGRIYRRILKVEHNKSNNVIILIANK